MRGPAPRPSGYAYCSLRARTNLGRIKFKPIDIRCRFYSECVRILKRKYSSHPEQCPFPDFGADQSRLFYGITTIDFERAVSQEYQNQKKKKEAEI